MPLRAAILFLLVLSFLSASAQKKKPEDEQVMRPNPAAATADAPSLYSCPAGGPLGEMNLQVKTNANPQPLPFANIVHLSEGDTVQYAPITRGREKREGEVAMVLVPSMISGKEQLLVTEVKDASKPQEWQIPRTISLAVFVYGPQGLSKKKVKSFLSQDTSLVAQMADYADKTAQTEALLQALSSSDSSPASMNAALTGFASQYGLAVQIDKTAPANVQAQTLFSAINPQLANNSPLAASGASQVSQTASLATAAAGLLFGSPVGLLAGGTSMVLELRSLVFPDTQFRSSYSQATKDSRVNLCGQRSAAPPHTRVAYIWASRIPNAATPKMQIGDAHYIPAGQKSPVTAEIADADWKYLQRARKWTLENDAKQQIEVPVLKLQNQKAVEVDLAKAKVPPGTYHLAAYWDWAKFQATGEIKVLPLSDYAHAEVKPESQDRILANGGKMPVTLTGSDFEFTSKVELKKVGDEFAVPEPVKFLLPKGPQMGPQEQMDVQLNTHDLEPGRYQLLLAQSDGKSHPVTFAVLPNPPKIVNLPIVTNDGVAIQHYVLKGERLNELTKLEAPGATFELGASSSGDTERNVTVKMNASSKPGTTSSVKAYLKDRTEPILFEKAVEVTGPLPIIVSSKLSMPADMVVKTTQDEFPAGYTLSAMVDVKNIERTSTLQLGCAEGIGQPATLQIGQQTAHWDLQQLSPDQLFVSFDTSSLPAGCTLQAVITNGKDGASSPYKLAHLIRVPQVDSVVASSEPAPAGQIAVDLKGRSLEMIEKAGWDASNGTTPTSLPTPIPGEGQKQLLHVILPAAPTPDAPIYFWLRGDSTGRETNLKLNPAPSGTTVGTDRATAVASTTKPAGGSK